MVLRTIVWAVTKKISGGSLEVKPEGKKTPLDWATTSVKESISSRVQAPSVRMSGGYMERH